MKIAIDVSPIAGTALYGHKVRGVGKYIEQLQNTLPRHDPLNEYIFINHKSQISYDFSVIHYPYFELFAASLPLRNTIPSVVTVHDLTPIKFPNLFPVGISGKIKWKLQKFLLSKTSAVVTDSKNSQSDVVAFTQVPVSKVHVVYLSVNKNFKYIKEKKSLETVRKKYNLPNSFALYVGDVTPNKNLPRLIQAIKDINLTLVLVGKALRDEEGNSRHPWEKDKREVKRLIQNDERFILLGFIPEEDLVAIYNLASVFIMPSLYEGFGLPLLEAMSCGCPVISSVGGSLPEVGGAAVRYIDEYDIKSMANGIGEVFFSKDLQKNLREKGLEQSKKFTEEKMVSDLVKVYESIASS